MATRPLACANAVARRRFLAKPPTVSPVPVPPHHFTHRSGSLGSHPCAAPTLCCHPPHYFLHPLSPINGCSRTTLALPAIIPFLVFFSTERQGQGSVVFASNRCAAKASPCCFGRISEPQPTLSTSHRVPWLRKQKPSTNLSIHPREHRAPASSPLLAEISRRRRRGRLGKSRTNSSEWECLLTSPKLPPPLAWALPIPSVAVTTCLPCRHGLPPLVRLSYSPQPKTTPVSSYPSLLLML